MPKVLLSLLWLLASGPFAAFAQQEETPPAQPPVATPAQPPVAAPEHDPNDDGVRVSVLGYHDFTISEPETEMKIKVDKFRKQMELIRELGITVISFDDFDAWKRGAKPIPEKSMLITVDDGWKSFHQHAYPVLKEFNYPFTLFLYKNYVDGGGKALTTTMIREMTAHGATIGSHSVSHPYPVVFKKKKREGEEIYDRFLRLEIGESGKFLRQRFKAPVLSYSYPGGYVTEEMPPLITELGYRYAFTIEPGKVRRDTPDTALPRFMILGNYDRVFEFATDYGDGRVAAAGLLHTPGHPVMPEAGSIIHQRQPTITADLAKVADLDPETLEMRVSGFTKVPAVFNPKTKHYSWQVQRPLRQPTCEVVVSWRNLEGEAPEKPLRWTFQIDREAAYLKDPETP